MDTTQAVTPAVAVEPVVDSTEADAVAEGTTGAESATAVADTNAPKTDRVQERIDRITREKYDALRERDYWQQRAEMARQPEAKPEPVAPVTPPTQEAYGYDETKFAAANAEYQRQIARSEAQALLTAERQRYAFEQSQATFQAREADFIKSKPDYLEKVRDPSLPISPPMAEAIRESDIGPLVAYYLAEHVDTARMISGLSPLGQAREIGRIEAALGAARAIETKPVVSKAPPPPATLETSSDVTVEKDPAKMTQAQFAKWRRGFMQK